MWLFVAKVLHMLLGIGSAIGSQIRAAWVQCRALILAGGALVAKYWAARLAWRVAIAITFIALMRAATAALVDVTIPSMSSLLSLFAPSSVTRAHEGIFHAFWDGGLNLHAAFSTLAQVFADLVTAWSCRKLWSLFLVRKMLNPPL